MLLWVSLPVVCQKLWLSQGHFQTPSVLPRSGACTSFSVWTLGTEPQSPGARERWPAPHQEGNPPVWLSGTGEMEGFREREASASWVASLKEVEDCWVRRVP